MKPKVAPNGGITWEGWNVIDRDGVSDACALRQIMATGTATEKLAIARAEQLAGRTVDRKLVAQGGHYHGDVFHTHKG